MSKKHMSMASHLFHVIYTLPDVINLHSADLLRRVFRCVIAVAADITFLKTITAVLAGTTGRRLLYDIHALILHTYVMDRAFYCVCTGRTADFERCAAVYRRRLRRASDDHMRPPHVYVAWYMYVYIFVFTYTGHTVFRPARLTE